MHLLRLPACLLWIIYRKIQNVGLKSCSSFLRRKNKLTWESCRKDPSGAEELGSLDNHGYLTASGPISLLWSFMFPTSPSHRLPLSTTLPCTAELSTRFVSPAAGAQWGRGCAANSLAFTLTHRCAGWGRCALLNWSLVIHWLHWGPQRAHSYPGTSRHGEWGFSTT